MEIFFLLAQCVWGSPQTLLGLLLFLTRRGKKSFFHGTAVTRWKYRSSVSLGLFLFVSEKGGEKLLAHEYGHAVQSLLLGPLYLPVVGLPSLGWAVFHRRRPAVPYDSFFTERWADRLGERVLKKELRPPG